MALKSQQPSNRTPLHTIRTGMLAVFAVLTLLIGIRHLLPGEAASGGSFDAFCPFGAIETLWRYLQSGQTLRTTNLLNFVFLGGTLMVALLAGRAFCGWMCPLGAVQEFLARLARRLSGDKHHRRGKPGPARLPLRVRPKADRVLRYAKYLLLVAILFASISAVYPPLHNFCPLRAVFGLQLGTGLLWSVWITFFVLSVLIERAWCKYLCPLGALLALFNRFAPLRLVANPGRCNQCGRCDPDCPMGIREVPVHLQDAECIQCLECLETCAREGSLELEVKLPGRKS